MEVSYLVSGVKGVAGFLVFIQIGEEFASNPGRKIGSHD
jgi:hypothetical protein